MRQAGMRRRTLVYVTVGACLLATAACSSSSGAKSGGSSEINIGIIVPKTGALAGEFDQEIVGAQVRLKQLDASGGINGHQVNLVVADDQSTPQGALTAAQSLVSTGVVATIGDTSNVGGAAEQYLAQKHIPLAITTASPASVADSNVFSPQGTTGPTVPVSKSLGDFLSGIGVTSIAGLAWGTAASSVSLMQAALKSANAAGITTAMTDLSPSSSTVDYTSTAVKLKDSHAESLFFPVTNSANIALAVSMQQQGVHVKAPVWSTTLLDNSILQDPHESAFENSYVQSWFAPSTLATPAVEKFVAAVEQYAPSSYPGFFVTYGYVLADVLVAGALNAGTHVTGPSVLAALHKITAYDGAGLTAKTLDFTKSKTDPANLESCYWYVQLVHKQFIPVSMNPTC